LISVGAPRPPPQNQLEEFTGLPSSHPIAVFKGPTSTGRGEQGKGMAGKRERAGVGEVKRRDREEKGKGNEGGMALNTPIGIARFFLR